MKPHYFLTVTLTSRSGSISRERLRDISKSIKADMRDRPWVDGTEVDVDSYDHAVVIEFPD